MVNPQPPADIPEYGRIEPEKEAEKERPTVPQPKTFESYMTEETTAPKPSEQISPMELAQKQQAAISPTADTLIGQVNTSQTQLGDIQDKLNTRNLTLKNSHQKLLNSKLTASNDHLRKASDYLGAQILPPKETPPDAEPIAKFLGYITDGQNQLLEAKRKLQEMQAKGGQIQPSEMMLIQVNLAQAQQEIEFSSVLLSKVVDALKQTLSIQL